MHLLFRSLGLVLLLLALYVMPAPAATPSNMFFVWRDGNGNGLLDYFGSDQCIGSGFVLSVYEVVPPGGLGQYFTVTLSNATYTVTTWAQMVACKQQSSGVYSLKAPAQYRMTGGGATTYFLTVTYGGTSLWGHRIP